MAMLIPTLAVPAQVLKVTLANQIVELSIYQRRYGMFIDVSVNGVLEIGAVICENRNRIIRSVYLNKAAGFSGDFIFDDLTGKTDPHYTGLGTRYRLLYLTQDELAALGFAA